MTTEEFIMKARKVHGSKYDYSKVDYKNTRTKVCIICPKHGEFWQQPRLHLTSQGCKQCVWEKQTKTIDEFIKEAKGVHGDKYDYSKVEYKNANAKVCIICPTHGEFWQTPNSHIKLKEGCPRCGHAFPYTTETFIEKANKIHDNKYDYSKTEYKNGSTKVCIVCPVHGEFWQEPRVHIEGCGCPQCATEYRAKHLCSNTIEFVQKAKVVHGDRYDYSKAEYKNCDTKICIICTDHGEFWQTPIGHINNKQGCPFCRKSKIENYIRLLLERCNIKYIEQAKFGWLKYKEQLLIDFYLPEYNIAIECQGGQHFQQVKYFGGEKTFNETKERDMLKYNQCINNHIEMLYVIPIRYVKTPTFNDFYCDKNYIIFSHLNDKIFLEKLQSMKGNDETKKLREALEL